jgi:coenzyme F420 hydrogenase subunit beta
VSKVNKHFFKILLEVGSVRKKAFSNLHKDVVAKGLCTGCGTCVGVCPAGAITFDFALEEPALKESCITCGTCYSTCPGQDIPLLKLEKDLFGEYRTASNELLGVSKAFFKGFAKSPHIRKLGTSGGLATALLLYALDQRMIDGAIVTTMNPERPWRVKPLVARTRTELIEAAKSKYAISPNNMALKQTDQIKRLAIVGLPCHIHGIRKVQSHRKLSNLADKIVIVLGLFCGSNWPYKATEHLIQEYSDVNFEEIERFEYRGGINSQDVKIFTHDKKEITITTDERRTVFQPMTKDRCRMCCDWTAELADLSFGDIFDPRQSSRKIPNWNSAIARTEKGLRLLEDAQKVGAIEISPLEETSFYGNIGFEIKKHGAVYHLMEKRRYGLPVPNYHYEFTWQARRKEFYAVPED